MITRKEFVKEWIADLRSGQYQQGTDCLERDNKYCCLGVACLTGERLGILGAGFGEQADQSPGSEFPGDWFIELFTTDNPTIMSDDGIIMDCSSANDYYNLSFNKIAQSLENHY